jgi:hypothetical protein
MTVTKPLDSGALRESTLDELTAQSRAVSDVRDRIKRAMRREVDRDSPVHSDARLHAVIDYVMDELVDEYIDREKARRRRDDVDEIPF